MKSLPVAVAASAIALVLPAFAAAPFETVFAKAGTACYARAYDRAHLKAHPRQTVSAIEVDFVPANPDGVKNTAAKFELGFGFQIRGRTDWYTNTSYCHAEGAGFLCSLESDGGDIRLTPQANALRLDVVNRGGKQAKADQINSEGASDTGSFGRPGGDDLSFILDRAPHAVCDASTADSGSY